MAKPPTYAEQLRKRYALPDGQVGDMLIHDLMNALEGKIEKGGKDSLSAPERLVFAVGKLDDMVGSDPGFDGYLKSQHADDWRRALEGIKEVGAAGYLKLAKQAAAVFGGTIPESRKERTAALKALDRKQKRLLEQLSSIWWQHNIQNAVDEEDIHDAPDGEPGTIKVSIEGPDGRRIEIDPTESPIPGVAEVMKEYKQLMSDAQAPPERERGIEMRLVDYFVANISAFDVPMTERDAARFEAVQAATGAISNAGSPAKALLALCGTPSPWIYGSSCGSEKPRRFPVGHLVGKGADARELKKLKSRLGSVAMGPEAFYADINGALLMRASKDLGDLAYPPSRIANEALVQYLGAAWSGEASGSAGFALYPIELWDESTKSLKEWYEALMDADPDADEGEGYPWLEHATSIGQVINSADHFVLVSGGDLAGKVLFTDHETLEADVFADSFDEFIGLIAGAPSWFLQRVLSDWRFEHGKDQFVPEAWMEERLLSGE